MAFQIQYDYYPTACTDVQQSYDDVERATKITANFVGRVNQPNLMYQESSSAIAAVAAIAYQSTSLTVLAKAGEATLTVHHRSITSELPLTTQFRLKVAPTPGSPSPVKDGGLDALLSGPSCGPGPVLDLNALIPPGSPMHQDGRTIVFETPILVSRLPGMEGIDDPPGTEYECSFDGGHNITVGGNKEVDSVVSQLIVAATMFLGLFLFPVIYNGFKLISGIEFDNLYNYEHGKFLFDNLALRYSNGHVDIGNDTVHNHKERFARFVPSSGYALIWIIIFIGIVTPVFAYGNYMWGIGVVTFFTAGVIGLQIHKYMEEVRLNKLPQANP